jgi:hypothetical protein
MYYCETYGRNGKLYRAEIAAGDSAATPLTLAADGLKITINGSEDVFEPLVCCGATITVHTAEDLTPIYSGTAQGVPVTITEEGLPIFCGFVTPCMYSQPLTARASDVAIECVDCLSTLKNIDYTTAEALPSFESYIRRACELAGGGVFALEPFIRGSYNVQLSDMAVADANWYDESGEPMKWSEVLTHVLRYADLRMVAHGARVLVECVRETVCAEQVALDDMTFNDSMSLSLSEVYNRVRATVSLYSDDSVVPQLWDGAKQNRNDNVGLNRFNEVVSYDKDKMARYYFRMYHNDAAKLYEDNGGVVPGEVANNSVIFGTKYNKVGGWMVRTSSLVWDKDKEADDYGESNAILSDLSSADHLIIGRANSLAALDDALLAAMRLGDKGVGDVPAWYSRAEDVGQQKVAQISDKRERVFAGDYTLVLSAKVRYSWFAAPTEQPAIGAGGDKYDVAKAVAKKFYNQGDSVPQSTMYLPFMLTIGNKSWYGDNLANTDEAAAGEWRDAGAVITTSRAYIAVDDTVRYKATYTDEVLRMQQLVVRNNVSWDENIGVRGLKIPITSADELAGPITLALYAPPSPVRGLCQWIFVDDLKLVIKRTDTAGIDEVLDDIEVSGDVEYVNVIDEANAIDGPTIDFKVGTDVGRDFCRGAVVNTADGYRYLGAVTHNVDGDEQLPEEHVLAAYVEQNSEPREVISGTVRRHLASAMHGYRSEARGKDYMVTKATIDLADTSSEIQLTETVY